MKHLFLLLTLILLSACDSSSHNTKTPEQIQAEVEASQKAFQENKKRIEQENKAREEKLIEQRSYVSAQFEAVSEEFIEVRLSNETSKDIDNIVGTLEVKDAEGNTITSVALTNWVPGDIYLESGGTSLARKNLSSERPDSRAQLLSQASELTYIYTTLRIQFVGEDEINYLAGIGQPKQTVVNQIQPTIVEIKPVNQATPEACTADQITLETEDIYYPGPECEHIGRNIDSEVVKLEYINMCKAELGITEHLPSIARVQVSSCIYETKRRGLTYRKRICCDIPM